MVQYGGRSSPFGECAANPQARTTIFPKPTRDRPLTMLMGRPDAPAPAAPLIWGMCDVGSVAQNQRRKMLHANPPLIRGGGPFAAGKLVEGCRAIEKASPLRHALAGAPPPLVRGGFWGQTSAPARLKPSYCARLQSCWGPTPARVRRHGRYAQGRGGGLVRLVLRLPAFLPIW